MYRSLMDRFAPAKTILCLLSCRDAYAPSYAGGGGGGGGGGGYDSGYDRYAGGGGGGYESRSGYPPADYSRSSYDRPDDRCGLLTKSDVSDECGGLSSLYVSSPVFCSRAGGIAYFVLVRTAQASPTEPHLLSTP